jgi:hypothetical protein
LAVTAGDEIVTARWLRHRSGVLPFWWLVLVLALVSVWVLLCANAFDRRPKDRSDLLRGDKRPALLLVLVLLVCLLSGVLVLLLLRNDNDTEEAMDDRAKERRVVVPILGLGSAAVGPRRLRLSGTVPAGALLRHTEGIMLVGTSLV